MKAQTSSYTVENTQLIRVVRSQGRLSSFQCILGPASRVDTSNVSRFPAAEPGKPSAFTGLVGQGSEAKYIHQFDLLLERQPLVRLPRPRPPRVPTPLPLPRRGAPSISEAPTEPGCGIAGIQRS